jgi:hypothetical protein
MLLVNISCWWFCSITAHSTLKLIGKSIFLPSNNWYEAAFKLVWQVLLTLPLWILHPYQQQPSKQAHTLPGLAQHSLLSVGQMYDSGCDVTFTSNKVTVKHGVATILDGTPDPDSCLWRVPLHEPAPNHSVPPHKAHNVYEQKSVQDTISYLHACCFIPVQDTWIKAIANCHLTAWPVLTVENVRKYLPKYDAMVNGHMNKNRKNIRSTQPKVTAPTSDPDMVQEGKCRYVYPAIIENGQIYIDLNELHLGR